MSDSESMKMIRFGVEIETVDVTRRDVAYAIAAALHVATASVTNPGGHYDKWTVSMSDGRVWTMMSDRSLSAYFDLQCEVVSPILGYADMGMLEDVVRAVRAAGAKIDGSCGVHVHVDAADFGGAALVRLVRHVYSHEAVLMEALGVQQKRRNKYCKSVSVAFIRRLAGATAATSRRDVMAAWYDRAYVPTVTYHNSRYRGINLHAVTRHGTVEFRYFEASLHAGEIRSYVQLCLAFAAKALHCTDDVRPRRRTYVAATAKADFRDLLQSIGIDGDEFEAAQYHLLKRLPDAAPVTAPAEAAPLPRRTMRRRTARRVDVPAVRSRLTGDYFRDTAEAYILSMGPRGARHGEIIRHIVRLHPEMVRSDGIVSGTVRQIMTDLPERRPAVARASTRGLYVPAVSREAERVARVRERLTQRPMLPAVEAMLGVTA